VQIYLF